MPPGVPGVPPAPPGVPGVSSGVPPTPPGGRSAASQTPPEDGPPQADAARSAGTRAEGEPTGRATLELRVQTLSGDIHVRRAAVAAAA
jgi:hypothetical protein